MKTMGEKLPGLLQDKKRRQVELQDIRQAFADKVKALRTESKSGESFVDACKRLAKEIQSLDVEIERCFTTPNQTVMDL